MLTHLEISEAKMIAKAKYPTPWQKRRLSKLFLQYYQEDVEHLFPIAKEHFNPKEIV